MRITLHMASRCIGFPEISMFFQRLTVAVNPEANLSLLELERTKNHWFWIELIGRCS